MTLNLTRNILFVIMLFSPIISLPVLTDVAEPWQLGFQDPATPTMEGIIEFHNNLMFFYHFNCNIYYLGYSEMY